jgi:Leucine-rich repeat (LRR) protein
MQEKPTLAQLVSRWQQLQQQGQAVSPEELCAGCPEHLDELRRRLSEDATVERFPQLSRLQGTTPSLPAAGPVGAARGPGASAFDFLSPPQGPGELGRLGLYRVLRLLGEGGMGLVFQAEDGRLKRMVALKVIRPEAAGRPGSRERFLREAQAAAALEHENIVTIHQVDEAGGVPFIAMPLLKGQSLEDRLQRGAVTVPQAVRLGRQIAHGLAAAHAAGLVHRDIKPANLWLEPAGGGRVKILDFGLAHVEGGEAGLTQSGTVLGTPSYMSPEQGRGERATARSDLFSLGVVLYRLCTGVLPFQGESTMAVLTALATHEPPPVDRLNPAVPQALAGLVTRLLAKDPARRPTTAEEVAERLGAIERQLAGPGVEARTEELPPGKEKAPPRPVRWKRVGVAVALLVLLALAWFFGPSVVRVATNQGELASVERERPAPPVVKAGKPEGKEAPVLAADERAAAKWALSLGGKIRIRIGGGEPVIEAVKDLPAGAFQVMTLDLPDTRVSDTGLTHLKALTKLTTLHLNNTQVSDAGLAHLEGLTNLTNLHLDSTQVSNAGLAHLESLHNLTTLGLRNTQVSDAGLAHLKGLTNLTGLNLSNTQVSDAGLAHLKGLTKLTSLHLDNTQVSDGGLAHLKGLHNLATLSLFHSQVSDAGLAYLKDLSNLTSLYLNTTQVSDAGLAHLKELTNLRYLGLNGTQVSDTGLAHLEGLTGLTGLGLGDTRVSDAGLASLKGLRNLGQLQLQGTQVGNLGLRHLKGLTKLGNLSLSGTRISDDAIGDFLALPLGDLNLAKARVSAKGFAQLKAALPRVRIDWSEPNRTAAEAVLALGGTVHIRAEGAADDRLVKAAADLPGAYFRVTGVGLAGVQKPLGDLCAKLALLTDPDFDALSRLDLAGSSFGDNDLQALGAMKRPAELSLKGTQVSDAGLFHLRGWAGLQRLVLDGLPITDAGLAALEGLPALTDLSLRGTQVDDAGLALLKGLKKLRRLALDGAPVRGVRLAANLTGLSELTELHLGCATLTDLAAGQLAELKALKKLARLSLAGSSVGDEALKRLHELAGLKELDLTNTKVSAAGVAAAKKALPGCRIVDGPAAR